MHSLFEWMAVGFMRPWRFPSDWIAAAETKAVIYLISRTAQLAYRTTQRGICKENPGFLP